MPKLWTALFGTLAFLWLVETVRLLWGMADLPRLADVAPLPDAPTYRDWLMLPHCLMRSVRLFRFWWLLAMKPPGCPRPCPPC